MANRDVIGWTGSKWGSAEGGFRSSWPASGRQLARAASQTKCTGPLPRQNQRTLSAVKRQGERLPLGGDWNANPVVLPPGPCPG